MDTAEDAVAQRLVEGLGALEGAPTCLERVEVYLACRLWGAECPDDDSGDEAKGEQEVPSDSRLDFVESLRRRVRHLGVVSGRLFGVLASGPGWYGLFLGSLGEEGGTSGGSRIRAWGDGRRDDRGCGTVG